MHLLRFQSISKLIQNNASKKKWKTANNSSTERMPRKSSNRCKIWKLSSSKSQSQVMKKSSIMWKLSCSLTEKLGNSGSACSKSWANANRKHSPAWSQKWIARVPTPSKNCHTRWTSIRSPHNRLNASINQPRNVLQAYHKTSCHNYHCKWKTSLHASSQASSRQSNKCLPLSRRTTSRLTKADWRISGNVVRKKPRHAWELIFWFDKLNEINKWPNYNSNRIFIWKY